jgi:hypothetical protein
VKSLQRDSSPPASSNPWSVAIIAAREDVATLASAIESAVVAVGREHAIVDVMINGNPALSRGVTSHLGAKENRARDEPRTIVRIWDLPLRDKAHAWNEYVHRIWSGSDVAFFLDGNVYVMPDALSQLNATLNDAAHALAATAVPSHGHSAPAMRDAIARSGGFAGNLHALRGSTLRELRELQIRLPLGLYRVDGLLGAILCFRFDPGKHPWNTENVATSWKSTWTFRTGSMWRYRDLRMQFNRMKRQALGQLENRAIREHLAINKQSPANLPGTAREMIVSWLARYPVEAARLILKNPLAIDAVCGLRRPKDWSQRDVPPKLVATASL